MAPTDSRLRPDQRMMEDALWDEANEEKVCVVSILNLMTPFVIMLIQFLIMKDDQRLRNTARLVERHFLFMFCLSNNPMLPR